VKVRHVVNTLTYPMETDPVESEVVISVRGSSASSEDAALVQRLRNRDEAAFLEIVQRHHGSLVRLAQSFVNNRAVAEEVAQETWLAVLQGIDHFEGRSSLKTWIFQILINRGRTRGVREARSINFSAMSHADSESSASSVDPTRFFATDDSRHPGGWVSQPQDWDRTPEQLLLSKECRTLVEEAIASLPGLQKEVISLRDVQGWDNEEICAVLGISEANCRVLLHRGRSRVRQALENYLGGANPGNAHRMLAAASRGRLACS
jgi:RNA polymerase sigma-70 factor (ECF subfamily)